MPRKSVSNRFQACSAKTRNSHVHCFTRGRLRVTHFVIHPQLLPLKPAHLVERQYVHTLDVPETRRESRHSIYFFHIVGPAGHDDEADPDRMSSRREATREFMSGFVVHAGKA